VSAAAPRACVSGVPGTLIHDTDALRFKNGELLGNQFDGTHFGSTHLFIPLITQA
jgi:hypothetical protein